MGTETPRDTGELPKRLESLDALRGFVMFSIMINFHHTAEYLFNGAIHGSIAATARAWRDVAMSVGVIAIEWSCLWVFWRQKLFLRI